MRIQAALVLLTLWVGGAWGGTFDEGKAAFGNQDWKTAAALFGRFVQDSPEDPQAPTAAFLRGVALYQQNDFRGSLDAFQKLERSWPSSVYGPKLPFWKGAAALAAGQWALAERESSSQARYPIQEPITSRALLNLALARVSLGKDDLAVEALGAFIKTSKEKKLLAQAWALWGDLDRKSGRTDSALTRYRAAGLAEPGGIWDLSSRTQSIDLLGSSRNWSSARDLLTESESQFPQEKDRWDPRWVTVARGLGDYGRLKKSLESLYLREKDPKRQQEYGVNRARAAEEAGLPEPDWWLKASRGPDRDLGGSALLRWAYFRESAGQWAETAGTLEAWVGPVVPEGWADPILSRAALDRLKAGDGPGASQDWDRLITTFPGSARTPGWLLARGRLALDSGRFGPALADFSWITKEFPRSPEGPEARYQTGMVYLRRGEPSRAEAWFYGLVEELKSGDLYQRALLARGISFVNSGQADLARGSLQRLLREAPEGPWAGRAWSALGRNALQDRQFTEATGAYTQAEAHESDPKDKAAALWSTAEAKGLTGDPAGASALFIRYGVDYGNQPKAALARYQQGAVYFQSKNWQKALDTWIAVIPGLDPTVLVQTREGMALAFLRLGKPSDGWDQLESLESTSPSPEVWYRWGQSASSLGLTDWALKAFQFILKKHPGSPAAEAALPRAAGALLTGGQPAEALERYADYFKKNGKDPASAPVARAAATAAQAFPQVLQTLVGASAGWGLAPEVAAEFSLAWARSRLDSDTERARGELQVLSQGAPWPSQKSEALAILGRWNLDRGDLAEARTDLTSAASLGDDLSVFKARWALALVTEKEGDLVNAARQRESAEKASGPGVPLEFRIQILKEAADTWLKAGRADDADRVKGRIGVLSR